MSTANKLSYLNDTKSLLRTSLNKFGSSILSTDTFRSYDTKLNDIYDKLPKITQSGAGFTIENVQNGQVDDFKMSGVDLEQDTTNGNQLIDFSSPLIITPSSSTTSTFIEDTLVVSSTSGTYNRAEWNMLNILQNNPSKTLKFGKQSYSSTNNVGNVQLRIKINNTITYVQMLNNNYTIPSDTTTITEAVFQVYSNNSATSLETTITIVKPLLYFDNNNTYEPYTGGIPSPNPDYPQEIKVVEGRQTIADKGKNKFYLNNNYSANYDEVSIEVNNNNSFILRMNKTSSNAQSPCATIEFNASYLKPNTTYTVSKKNSNTGYVLDHVGSIRLYTNGSYGNFIDADEYTFTTPNEITSFKILLYLFFNNSTTGNYEITFYDIQFEENSTATDFEPYTGGIPSPNPDYPQEIKVVEGRQVINVKGKNLFNFGIRSRNQNGITTNYNFSQAIINGTTTNDDSIVGFSTKKSEYSISLGTYSAGSYVFKFEKVSGNLTYPSGASAILIRNSNDTIIFKNNVNSETTNYTKSFTLEQETELFIQWFVNESNWTFTDYICRFMIISDTDSATDYEPYYEPVSYNIDLQLANIYLAKMPDTTYKNRIYKNNGNWYYEENVKKIVLDGSEDITLQNTVNNIIGVRLPIGNNVKPQTRVYCSHLKDTTFNNYYDHRIYGMIASHGSQITTNLFASAPNESIITIDQYKNWLSTNNTTVYCILDNPVTTQITNTTLINQLEAISVYTGTNIITISNSNNIIPEIEITRLKELEKLS